MGVGTMLVKEVVVTGKNMFRKIPKGRKMWIEILVSYYCCDETP